MDYFMMAKDFLTFRIAYFNIQNRLKSMKLYVACKYAILERFGKWLIYKK